MSFFLLKSENLLSVISILYMHKYCTFDIYPIQANPIHEPVKKRGPTQASQWLKLKIVGGFSHPGQ